MVKNREKENHTKRYFKIKKLKAETKNVNNNNSNGGGGDDNYYNSFIKTSRVKVGKTLEQSDASMDHFIRCNRFCY